MTKIKFGIQIEPQFGYDFETVRKIVLMAEQQGFYSIWSSDHFFLHENATEINCLEAWSMLAAISSITTKIRMGTLVTGNSYRNPALLAKIASTVDHISKGRLEFGIGAGWKKIEYDAYGYYYPPVKERMEALEEALQIIKLLWTEPKATFEGKHYTIKEAISFPKPVQFLPPIFIGGTSKKYILKMVAKYGDYCNFGWFVPPDEIPDLLNVLKDHCQKIGRDYESVGKSFFAYVILGENETELDELVEKLAKKRNLTPEDYKKRLGNGVFFGTPEQVKERFDRLIDLGFTYFQVMFPFGFDYDQALKFSNSILPQF